MVLRVLLVFLALLNFLPALPAYAEKGKSSAREQHKHQDKDKVLESRPSLRQAITHLKTRLNTLDEVVSRVSVKEELKNISEAIKKLPEKDPHRQQLIEAYEMLQRQSTRVAIAQFIQKIKNDLHEAQEQDAKNYQKAREHLYELRNYLTNPSKEPDHRGVQKFFQNIQEEIERISSKNTLRSQLLSQLRQLKKFYKKNKSHLGIEKGIVWDINIPGGFPYQQVYSFEKEPKDKKAQDKKKN